MIKAEGTTPIDSRTKVFVRIRPPHAEAGCLSTKDGKKVQHLGQCDSNGYQTSLDFLFDKVFDSHVSQEEVFLSVRSAVGAAMAGCNAGILAYGQTGSGKTHTLLGSLGKNSDAGILPRAVHTIFQQCNGFSNTTVGP